jgi:hypothetical protein
MRFRMRFRLRTKQLTKALRSSGQALVGGLYSLMIVAGVVGPIGRADIGRRTNGLVLGHQLRHLLAVRLVPGGCGHSGDQFRRGVHARMGLEAVVADLPPS